MTLVFKIFSSSNTLLDTLNSLKTVFYFYNFVLETKKTGLKRRDKEKAPKSTKKRRKTVFVKKRAGVGVEEEEKKIMSRGRNRGVIN